MSSPDGGWEYALAHPHLSLGPGVLSYRGFRLASCPLRRRLEIPCGLATLVIGFGRPLRVVPHGSPDRSRSVVSLLSPPGTGSATGEHTGGLQGVEVILTPWAAFELFGVALHELGLGLDPAEIVGPRFHDLSQELDRTPCWTERFALVDRFLLRCRSTGRTASDRVVSAWRQLESAQGMLAPTALAERLECSQRQLERRCGEQLGLTPKRLARVLRLQHAATLLAAGIRPGEVAPRCGFYDQAHLTREFTAMTGLPPLRFVAAHQAGGADVNRATGRITSILLDG
ncbi:helix-turn-helix transcriptional regulator [Streptomyces sp. G44]|uniref:helix-turn-helix domain-containing protein n=1 Tax=Streptomyces sp. G44 TaxID=2807632 RepID=UPI00195F91BD|nr:helix-turn-helix domain-containing protein [Streptomyces sp. G44]MBM7169864.1 helix-turn-helix transcriptional regulator [Streptomyces sp. G44]